jgi:hypothetical protein
MIAASPYRTRVVFERLSRVSISRGHLFRLLAIGSGAAALYHLLGALGFLPNSVSPVWRHVLFVAIDMVGIWYFQKRPAWLFPAYVALVVQQTLTHGQQAIEQWRTLGTLDLISIIDLAALYIGLVALCVDLAGRFRGQRSGNTN